MKRLPDYSVKLVLFGMMLLTHFHLFAQPNDGDIFESVTDTPINTGIALMAFAGIGYGLKKINSRRK
jgi:hypothetical protein